MNVTFLSGKLIELQIHPELTLYFPQKFHYSTKLFAKRKYSQFIFSLTEKSFNQFIVIEVQNVGMIFFKHTRTAGTVDNQLPRRHSESFYNNEKNF